MEQLTWLPNSMLKDVRKPKVRFEEYKYQNYSGYYTHNSAILTIVCDGYEESTIVHEFIHYLQEVRGKLPTKYVYHFDNFADGYDLSIRKYFALNWWETEALYYQNKLCKDDVSEYWVKHCLGLNLFNKIT